MSLTAAASGFVAIILAVQEIQGQDDWGVTYSSTEICVSKGSTVEINCTYTHPSRIYGADNDVGERFWSTKLSGNQPVDLRTDSDYQDRVEYSCSEKSCSLRIRDLRESDSAEYKFKFITDQVGGRYTGSPGVTLRVTALQVQVTRITVNQYYTKAELKCHNSCSPAGHLSYVWFKNGKKMLGLKTSSYKGRVYAGDIISCALEGHEESPSPSVYAPKFLFVSVSPSAEIVEGSSVILTCSSDANPAANYTWYKGNGTQHLQPLSKEPQLVFSSIQSSDSGEYYCTAENELGRTFKYVSINVTYAPRLPSVSVNPSTEIVEGSSVTLTCSSDANPAANYTWYKENEDSPKASGQIFTITDFRAEHSGNYSCEIHNTRGQFKSTLYLGVTASPVLNSTTRINIVRLTLVVLILIPLILIILHSRHKKTPVSSTTEDNIYAEVEMRERHSELS